MSAPTTGQETERAPARIADAWIVAALVVPAALVMLPGLGSKSFWLDEAFTWSSVHRSLPAFVKHLTTSEGGYALYLTFMWPLARVSASEWWLRLPSAIFALALVPTMFVLGRRLAGRRVGLLAALLVAVNANLVEYGQEARPYTLTMLLAALAGVGFVGMVRRGRRSDTVLWAVAGGLMVWSLPLAAGVLAAQLLALFALPVERRPWRAVLHGAIGLALLVVPYGVLTLAQSGHRGRFLESGRTVSALVRAAASLVGKGGPPLILAYGLLALVAAWAAWGVVTRTGRSELLFTYALAGSWLVVPAAFTVAVSFVQPLFAARYLLPGLPAVTLVGALGIDALPGRAWRIAATTVVVALAALGIVRALERPKDDWRTATALVLRDARPGDGVVFFNDQLRVPFEYYTRDRQGAVAPLTPLSPRAPWGHFRTGDERFVVPSAAAMARYSAAHPRIWVLSWPDRPGSDEALASLRKTQRVVLHRHYDPDLTVELYARR